MTGLHKVAPIHILEELMHTIRSNVIMYAAGLGGIIVGGLLVFFLYPQVSISHTKRHFLSQDAHPFSTSTVPVSYAQRDAQTPILVYHIVRPAYPSDTREIRQFAVTPELFDQQMAYLQNNGYHVMSFAPLEAYFAGGPALPPHAVIITFDDAWEDQYIYAFPILEKYHYTATFFIPTNFPDHPGFISWNQLRTMSQAGMSIESHSESHPYLSLITSTSTLWNEIDGSKLILQKELGITPTEFAYPFGEFDPQIIALVQQAGYKLARGDYLSTHNSAAQRYALGVVNAPTTMTAFETLFPVQ